MKTEDLEGQRSTLFEAVGFDLAVERAHVYPQQPGRHRHRVMGKG